MPIVNRIADLHAEITAWRRDLHAHPELLFDVHRTAGLVAEKLKAFGCDEVVTGIGRTGVVGVIKRRKDAARRPRKVIGLRADMDALPIDEANDLPYKSTMPGKMHACGHDGHTAMLLGAARYLAETRNFGGTAVVIFQPAEEGGGGGREMVKDGMMERFGIEEVYGMHNYPGMPVGEFAIRPGPDDGGGRSYVSSTSRARARMPRGRISAIDPILVGAQIINQLQSIVSRNVDPLEVGGGVDLRRSTPAPPTTSSRRPRGCPAPSAASPTQVRDLLETRRAARSWRAPRSCTARRRRCAISAAIR